MHPFCCISPVSDHNPSPKPDTDSPPLMTLASRSNSLSHHNLLPPAAAGHHRRNGSAGGGSQRASSSAVLTTASSVKEPAVVVDVKINDIVGNGISGILYKWVNYGKGWRPRWFVLQDGVLSYYKIHGPDRIVVNQETEKGSKVIGEESLRRINRPRIGNSPHKRKPVGEIHLKVSSIRESRSDDKRFSIFTGTKRLHLRAEMREDRMAWMEALQAVKDMFPRMSNSELMAPVDDVSVSTEKLRKLLLDEGVREDVIQESEQIMRNEFSRLQNQIVLLKQKQLLLTDTLRQLEVHPIESS